LISVLSTDLPLSSYVCLFVCIKDLLSFVFQILEQGPSISKAVGVGHVVCQEFIAASSGKDVRVVVVGGKIVGAMMRIAKSGFKSNVHQGGYVKKVKVVKEALVQMATDVTRLCHLDISGIDLLMDTDGYKLCEVCACVACVSACVCVCVCVCVCRCDDLHPYIFGLFLLPGQQQSRLRGTRARIGTQYRPLHGKTRGGVRDELAATESQGQA
jgi:hypothetical protein